MNKEKIDELRIQLKNFMDKDFKITSYLAKFSLKEKVIDYVSHLLPREGQYTEKEINAFINELHTFGDPALIRRELVEHGYIKRTPDGSKYFIKES